MMISTFRNRYKHLLFILCNILLALSLSVVAKATSSFSYGQCLTNRGAFNQDLKDYNSAALMTASIKAFALKKNSNLLKWDYETVKFIYNLNLVKKLFENLVEAYKDPSDVALRNEMESYLIGVKGNDLLQQLQMNGPYEDTESLTSFKQFLSKADPRKSERLSQIHHNILRYLENQHRVQALVEVYEVIQSASLTIDFLSLKALQQWLVFLDIFLKKPMIKTFIAEAFKASPTEIIDNKEFHTGVLFSEEDYNLNPVWKSELPPLMDELYPTLSNNEAEAQKLIKFLYTRTLEDFLFSMNGIDYTAVEQWMAENNFSPTLSISAATPSSPILAENKEKNQNTSSKRAKNKIKPTKIQKTKDRVKTEAKVSKANKPGSRQPTKRTTAAVASANNFNKTLYFSVLKRAQTDEKSKLEPTVAKKIFVYLDNQERVYSNAFDNYVWHKQEGSAVEKAIDGVARTLYSEADICQKLENSNQGGIYQFEAMGLAIANRSVEIDKENRILRTFNQSNPLNYEEANNPRSEYNSSTRKVGDYYESVRDFGRNKESMRHPLVTEMPTAAQVVSKPVHFSVWKIAKTETYSAINWIPKLLALGYPEDFKLAVAGASKSNLDYAQFKALCPTDYPEVFKHALGIASQIVTNPYAYVQKYKIYEKSKKGGQYVKPYFFTHGPKTKLGAKSRPLGNITLIDTNNVSAIKQSKTLKMIDPNSSLQCRTFKLYGAHEKHLWTQKLVDSWKKSLSSMHDTTL